ncbi:hypothetical protein A0H81_14745 [Grifola frondosa]|uniref:Uncharacterized protein n=1 Tax=Grifola frondosa TaxID=5627 RepID=A0A1C7LKX0_GRIFR|nr:hypothetical protein A0H81_14745 [Grifola frondosa]
MPHRVDDVVERSYGHHSDNAAQYQYMHSHPTPPPIATLHNSPALSASSLESSSISPSPPQLSQPSTPYYTHPGQGPAMNPSQAYPYNPNVSMGARYANDMQHHQGSHPGSPFTTSAHIPGQVSTRSIRPTFVPTQPYPGQASYIIHTDDASTKLSDRPHPRKSALQQMRPVRAHALASAARAVPPQKGPYRVFVLQVVQDPAARRASPAHVRHDAPAPPHHYNHPSLGPLMSTRDSQNHYRASAVPDIGNLLNGPTDGPPGAPGSNAQEAIDGGAQKRPLSPAQSPRGERRDAPSYRSSN